MVSTRGNSIKLGGSLSQNDGRVRVLQKMTLAVSATAKARFVLEGSQGSHLERSLCSMVEVKSGPIALFKAATKLFSYCFYQYTMASYDVFLIYPYDLLQERAQNLTVPSGRVKQFRCAFFNFTGGANQTGGWSYRGVETEVINDTHVRCNASHLTSFVVLVSIVPAVGDPVSNRFSIQIVRRGCIIPSYADTIYKFSHPTSLPSSFSFPWTTSHTLVAAFL